MHYISAAPIIHIGEHNRVKHPLPLIVLLKSCDAATGAVPVGAGTV